MLANRALGRAVILHQGNITRAHIRTGTRVQVVAFPTKYPSGGAKQIIQILTGREIPTDHHSAYIGVICLNVGTVAAAWRAVRYGEPLISRITTVVGESLVIQRNVEVCIGTPIDYFNAQHGFDANQASRLIMGGPMMGFTLPNPSVPVIKTTNCILAPTKKRIATATAGASLHSLRPVRRSLPRQFATAAIILVCAGGRYGKTASAQPVRLH